MTAFLVAGVSIPGLLVAATVVSGFLAHEPAAVVRGVRGGRARRELGPAARRWLAVWLVVMIAAGAGSVGLMTAAARWSVAIPLVPAIVLAIATARGMEKSSLGETAAALAFTASAVPIVLAGGASARTAAHVALPFALFFAGTTLAVRVVTVGARRGATAGLRAGALCVVCGGAAGLALAASSGVLPPSVLAAAAPGLVTAAAVALRPPAPAHLRRVGWTLIAISLLTGAGVVATA